MREENNWKIWVCGLRRKPGNAARKIEGCEGQDLEIENPERGREKFHFLPSESAYFSFRGKHTGRKKGGEHELSLCM